MPGLWTDIIAVLFHFLRLKNRRLAGFVVTRELKPVVDVPLDLPYLYGSTRTLSTSTREFWLECHWIRRPGTPRTETIYRPSGRFPPWWKLTDAQTLLGLNPEAEKPPFWTVATTLGNPPKRDLLLQISVFSAHLEEQVHGKKRQKQTTRDLSLGGIFALTEAFAKLRLPLRPHVRAETDGFSTLHLQVPNICTKIITVRRNE